MLFHIYFSLYTSKKNTVGYGYITKAHHHNVLNLKAPSVKLGEGKEDGISHILSKSLPSIIDLSLSMLVKAEGVYSP